MKPGTTVYLPSAPPSRKGAKPRPRTGVVVASDWAFPGHVMVKKSDREGAWWVPINICKLNKEEVL